MKKILFIAFVISLMLAFSLCILAEEYDVEATTIEDITGTIEQAQDGDTVNLILNGDLILEKGIQIVAFTDHDVFIRHNDLTDENFLALNGYEVEINKDTGLQRPMHRSVTTHICLVALSPDITTPACLHRSKYLILINHSFQLLSIKRRMS